MSELIRAYRDVAGAVMKYPVVRGVAIVAFSAAGLYGLVPGTKAWDDLHRCRRGDAS